MNTKLISAREVKFVSQEEMAEQLNISQPSYCRRELGLIKIRNAEWEKMAKILGLNKEDIYEPYDRTNNNTKTNEKTSKNKQLVETTAIVLEYIEFLKSENKRLREKLERYEG